MYNTLHKFKLAHYLGRNLLTDSFPPFRWSYKLFRKINFSKKVTRNGNSYTILLQDGMGVMNFISNYEDWLDKLLNQILTKNNNAVFIDIGANIGQTMLKVLPSFPKVKYFAIEPNKNCVDYLKALIKINKFESVKIMEYGLSDSIGEGELLTRYQDDILATTTHSFRKFTKYSNKQKISIISGDELFKSEDLQNVSIIKIDIEGGESKAIDGLIKTINTFRPFIICEIAPINTKDKGVTEFRKLSAGKILDRLHELKYLCINVITNSFITKVEDLSDSLESCNYIFIPEEKKDSNEFI